MGAIGNKPPTIFETRDECDRWVRAAVIEPVAYDHLA